MNVLQDAVVIFEIQPALRLRTAIRLGRIVAVGTVVGLLPVFPDASFLIVVLAFIAVVLGIVSLSFRRPRRALLATELALSAIVGGAVAWLSVASVLAEDVDGTSVALLLAAIAASVWLIHRVRCFMYPATADPIEFERVTELLYDDMERKTSPSTATGRGRAMVEMFSLVAIGLFLGPLQAAYFTCLLCLAAVYWVSRLVWPALRSLLAGESFPVLSAGLARSPGTISRSYVWYLLRHGGNRPQAYRSFLTSASSLTGAALIGYLPDYVTFIPSTIPSIIAPGLICLSYVTYRSALTSLAAGLGETEARRIEASSDFSLYLRSFADDPIELDFAARGWRRMLLLLVFGGRPEGAVFRSIRVEEFLTRAVWRHRPLLAVSPSSNTNPVGALQLSFTDDGWRDGVVRLARRARSILLVAGNSPGLRWELEQLTLDPVLREKVLLLLPPVREDYLEPRWNASLGSTLDVPAHISRRTLWARFLADGRIGLITADWPTPSAYRIALRVAEDAVMKGDGNDVLKVSRNA